MLKQYQIKIYTDGSSTVHKQNGLRYGGIGVYFPDYPENNISNPYKGTDVTNQRMELTACITGISKCLDIIEKIQRDVNNYEIHIYTDSMYTINCITKWATKWEKLGWKRMVGGDISNLDLIKTLYEYNKTYKLKFYHVRAHQKESKENNDWYGNHMADKLATDATAKSKHNLDKLDKVDKLGIDSTVKHKKNI